MAILCTYTKAVAETPDEPMNQDQVSTGLSDVLGRWGKAGYKVETSSVINMDRGSEGRVRVVPCC